MASRACGEACLSPVCGAEAPATGAGLSRARVDGVPDVSACVDLQDADRTGREAPKALLALRQSATVSGCEGVTHDH